MWVVSRALGADRVLDHLNHHFLALTHQVGNGERRAVAAGRRLAREGHRFGTNIGNMQKRGALQADVHERRFHAGQYPGDPALVDVAHQAPLARPFDQNLLQNAVFDHGDPGFAGRDVDQDFVTGAAFGACRHGISVYRKVKEG